MINIDFWLELLQTRNTWVKDELILIIFFFCFDRQKGHLILGQKWEILSIVELDQYFRGRTETRKCVFGATEAP